MSDWEWSDWITPGLVYAKANLGRANAGAGVSIGGSSDPNEAVDAVRTGGATAGGSLAPGGTGPYTYSSGAEVNADPFSNTYDASAYDRSGMVPTTPPESYAFLNVGYSSGYWRERPDLRRFPPEFLELDPSEYVPIDPTDFTWAGFVEFEPGVDTVAVEWAPIWVHVSAPEAGDSNEVGGNIGYSPSIILPPTPGGDWSGSFSAWPPPLGEQVLSWDGPSSPADQLLPVTPPPGSDFTIVSYTDMAVGGYSPNNEWQQWNVRPYGGPIGSSLFIWHQMPRYRYRVPVSKQPRFYVKNLDETMRPVGDGKPASELSVFRVPTAQGWFRDLTTDEYAVYGTDVRPPGGYPLKVKRLDSAGDTWWDQVGWMVPDEA